jgi:PilZ domain
MTERRRQRRIPVDQLMEVLLVTDGVETLGRVVDLNNAGAFVATDLVLEKGTKLEVELRIAGADKSLPLQAVVARRIEAVEGREHTIPAGLGLVFLTSNVMERAFVQMAVLAALKTSLEATRVKVAVASASRTSPTVKQA